MDAAAFWVMLLLGFTLVFLLTRRNYQPPTLCRYLDLLHKHKDPNHPKLVAMREEGDDDFQRRTGALNDLWEATRELRG